MMPQNPPSRAAAPRAAAPRAASDAEQLADASELMFFAYRDFIAEPDKILAPLGLGRAHHRLLHFVARAPGIHIAQLLEILQITKQSLARVLRDMVIGGYITQKQGQQDKRQRLLFATSRGAALYQELSRSQYARLRRARGACGEAAFASWQDCMRALCDTAEQSHGRKPSAYFSR